MVMRAANMVAELYIHVKWDADRLERGDTDEVYWLSYDHESCRAIENGESRVRWCRLCWAGFRRTGVEQ